MPKLNDANLNKTPNHDKGAVIVHKSLIATIDQLEQSRRQLIEDNQTQGIAISHLVSFILYHSTCELSQELVKWFGVDLYASIASKINSSRVLALEELLEQANSDDLKDKLTALLQRHADFEDGKLKAEKGFF